MTLEVFHQRPLRDQFGISFKLERRLQQVGINSMHDLMEVGAAAAYLRVREMNGGKQSVSTLYAFLGAIAGEHWFDFTADEKRAIRQQAGID